jgi:hypothetical protein
MLVISDTRPVIHAGVWQQTMNTRFKLIRMALAIVMIAAGRPSSTAQEQKASEDLPNPAVASIESLNIVSSMI